MTTTTRNGRATPHTLPQEESLPVPTENPFLRPAWPTAVSPEMIPLPSGAGLTKEQRAIYDQGGAHLLKQHFQRIKTVYAISASAQVEDLANRSFVHVGTNIVLRKRANPYEELAPYLELMMDAQEMFADNVKPGFRQEMMDIGDAAVQRVLDRDDSKIGLAFANGVDRIFESGRRHGSDMRQRLARGEIGIGTQLALEGDRLGLCNQRRCHR